MFRSNRLVIIVIALISSALLAAACGSDPTPPPTSVPQAQPTAIPTAVPTATTVPTQPAPTATHRPPPEISFPTAIPPVDTAPAPTAVLPAPTAKPVPQPTPDLGASISQTPPQIFIGTATIDGAPAADGTVVTVLKDGVEVASVVVTEGAYPVLQVPNPGMEVTFKLGDLVADQTASTYLGGADVVNLTASR